MATLAITWVHPATDVPITILGKAKDAEEWAEVGKVADDVGIDKTPADLIVGTALLHDIEVEKGYVLAFGVPVSSITITVL